MTDTTEAVAAIRARVEAARARAERATPGPWKRWQHIDPPIKTKMVISEGHGTVADVRDAHMKGNDDAEFIAAARSDVPQLADDVLVLCTALEFYAIGAFIETAESEHFPNGLTIRSEGGKRARAALASCAAQGGE